MSLELSADNWFSALIGCLYAIRFAGWGHVSIGALAGRTLIKKLLVGMGCVFVVFFRPLCIECGVAVVVWSEVFLMSTCVIKTKHF